MLAGRWRLNLELLRDADVPRDLIIALPIGFLSAVSGGTHTDTGRACRDAFLGLAKTCRKLSVAFWTYLGDRIGVAGAPAVASLSDLIRSRGQPAGAG